MNIVRKALTGLGGICLAALVVAALAPKATHGIVAALVQVTNTTANPVPVTDVGSLQPFESNCAVSQGSATGSDCFISVPAGKRLVIQSVSMQLIMDRNVQPYTSGIIVTTGGNETPIYFNVPFGSIDFFGHAEFNETKEVHAYMDGGSSVFCHSTNTALSEENDISCSVFGYLVNE